MIKLSFKLVCPKETVRYGYTTNVVPFEHFVRLYLAPPIFLESISSPFCHNMKIPIKIKFCNISTKGRISQNNLLNNKCHISNCLKSIFY